jgi:hypothetical protein
MVSTEAEKEIENTSSTLLTAKFFSSLGLCEVSYQHL